MQSLTDFVSNLVIILVGKPKPREDKRLLPKIHAASLVDTAWSCGAAATATAAPTGQQQIMLSTIVVSHQQKGREVPSLCKSHKTLHERSGI